jgi:hypothetical protein
MDKKSIFEGSEPRMVADELLKLILFSFDVIFDSVAKVQDFKMKLLKEILERSKDVHADTVHVVSDLIESAKKRRDEYKKMLTEGLEKIGKMLSRSHSPGGGGKTNL